MNLEEMTLAQARMVWLTMLGSDWISEDIFMDYPHGSTLDLAANILDLELELEYDPPSNRMRIRCKS